MAKTKINKKQLYENRNTSDLLSRLVIMGLLRILNMQLRYTQVWDDKTDDIEEVIVPFFYDFSGGNVSSERFIQDNYLQWSDEECTSIGIKKMPGDYKPIPFGVVVLNNTSIDSGNIANRFVLGRYTKRENKQLKSYVSFLYSIPLSFSFNVQVQCDTINSMWKIEQAIREYFYKNKTYHINYKGLVVPVRVGFPDSIGIEKNATYQMGQAQDNSLIKLSMELAAETYQPVFDPYSEMAAEHTMNNFAMDITVKNNEYDIANHGYIRPVTDLSGLTLVCGQEIMLEWRYYYQYSDMLAVDILYREKGDTKWKLVESVNNNNFYHLEIPDDFVDNNINIDLTILNTDKCTVQQQPIIKIAPHAGSVMVDDESIIIISKGFFITEESTVDGVLEYEGTDGKIHNHKITFNLVNNMIDEENPVKLVPFKYKNTIIEKFIQVAIRDRAHPEIIINFMDEDDYIRVI